MVGHTVEEHCAERVRQAAKRRHYPMLDIALDNTEAYCRTHVAEAIIAEARRAWPEYFQEAEDDVWRNGHRGKGGAQRPRHGVPADPTFGVAFWRDEDDATAQKVARWDTRYQAWIDFATWVDTNLPQWRTEAGRRGLLDQYPQLQDEDPYRTLQHLARHPKQFRALLVAIDPADAAKLPALLTKLSPRKLSKAGEDSRDISDIRERRVAA